MSKRGIQPNEIVVRQSRLLFALRRPWHSLRGLRQLFLCENRHSSEVSAAVRLPRRLPCRWMGLERSGVWICGVAGLASDVRMSWSETVKIVLVFVIVPANGAAPFRWGVNRGTSRSRGLAGHTAIGASVTPRFRGMRLRCDQW